MNDSTGTGAKSGRCKVLAVIGEPTDGVGYARFVVPFGRLKTAGYDLATLGASLNLTPGPDGYEPDPALLDDISVLMFPQFVPSPALADGNVVNLVGSLCAEAERRGIPIVYSVDDCLAEVDPSNPGYERVRTSDNVETIRRHAASVFVTTEPLQDAMACWNLPVHLLPNTIEPAHWELRPRSSGELRIGWAGSSSHLEDLLLVLPAIGELQRRVDFRFVVFGLCDLPIDRQLEQIREGRSSFTPAQNLRAHLFEDISARLQAITHAHVPFRQTESFIERLPQLDLDLGICPLIDKSFNRHKSAIKFYEYAVSGTMTVASHVTPYADEVSVTVNNETDSWRNCLERFLKDTEAREQELERQRTFVLGERNAAGWTDRWDNALRSVRKRHEEGKKAHATEYA